MPSVPVTIVGVLTYAGSDLPPGGGGGGGGDRPGIWPSPGYPAHPIAPGGPPPGIWPSPGYPAHPIAPGGPPPGIWPSPGYPAHPIAPGGPPPGIWPGPGPLPGVEHPIVLPLPGQDGESKIEWKTAWSPQTGWIVVGIPSVDHPVPADQPKP